VYNATYIPIFNQNQMDLDNVDHGFDDLDVGISTWIGELAQEGGEPMAGVLLVGPIVGEDPTTEQNWDRLVLTGEGRAMAIVWIDRREVARGLLDMAGGPGDPNQLNFPEGVTEGQSCVILLAIQGKMLGCEVFYEPLASGA
jgi:hypothetical protein